MIQRMLAIWSLVPLPFPKPAWTSGSSQFMYCWSLAWRISTITLLWLWSQQTPSSNDTRKDSTRGHHQIDGQHRNQTDYILCSQRWRISMQSANTRPGADCGSHHELLIAKFRFKLKKVGKTTRPFSEVAQSCPTVCNSMDHSSMTLIKSLMIIHWKWEIDLRD